MKIMILASFCPSLMKFRGDLIREIQDKGHEVLAVAPEKANEFEEKLSKLGCRYVRVPMQRAGMNPIKDLGTLRAFRQLMASEKPNVVLAYTAKPIIYGCIAAKSCEIRDVYAIITGLGSVFYGTGLRFSFVRVLMKNLYRVALRSCRRVFFQNTDNLTTFERLGIVQRSKSVVINGSGVNLAHYRSAPWQRTNTFLFVGRILRDKGIVEYVMAAKEVKKKFPDARFLVVGPFDDNPSALRKKEFGKLLDDDTIEHIEWVDDVRPFYQYCSTFVLPSYHEGTPRSVLEAMATGRPIITTNAPGCRETVEDGVNGFLIPVKDVGALAEKMIWLIEHPEKAKKMGEESLRICREKYDVNKVNNDILEAMGL